MGAAILTTGEAARRAELSSEYLRQLAKEGRLASIRTERGQYLFEASEIERLIHKRESAKAARTANNQP